MTTHARARRENQPVPATAESAAARFKCEAYLCTMSGNTCRDQHLHAVEFRPENRDACIACPAGAARARLLGVGNAAVNRVACAGKTAKGAPCPNVVTEGATAGLCHGCNGNARGHVTQAATKEKAPRAPRPKCKRSGCDRDTVPGTLLPDFCRGCFNSASASLKISLSRKPTDDERAKWLSRVPAHRRPAALSLPQMPVPDVHVAVSPEAVDQVLANEPPPPAPTTDAPPESATPVCAPEPPAGNAARTAAAVKLPNPCTHLASVDRAGWAAAQAMWRTCSDSGDVVEPHSAPSPASTPDVTTIRVSLSRRAYAELGRMVAAGLHGDDPVDVARTLILEGLRRWAAVRQ